MNAKYKIVTFKQKHRIGFEAAMLYDGGGKIWSPKQIIERFSPPKKQTAKLISGRKQTVRGFIHGWLMAQPTMSVMLGKRKLNPSDSVGLFKKARFAWVTFTFTHGKWSSLAYAPNNFSK